MGTSDLNFYINKHRKAYEERLKREQQNLQGKTAQGETQKEAERETQREAERETQREAERETQREAERVSPSEVAKGGANEQSDEAENWSKNQNEGYSQHASQSDATRNSTRDENMNQVDADYLFALKLNEALNGCAEPPSVENENHIRSGSHARSAHRNEDAEDDVRKPDNSYVECLLGDNNYMPFCVNYNVGSDNMNQNPLSPSGRNRRSGHYVDHDEGGHMYGPYNLRSRNNRVNAFHSSNQSSGNSDRRYAPHFNSSHEPINISLSSDDEEGEDEVKNPAGKNYVSQDDGLRSSSEVFYVHDGNLSLTPRQSNPSGQSNLGRPFSTSGEDSKDEVTIVEGLKQERFSDKGVYHPEEGNPDVCIQARKGKGGEIHRIMGSANNFAFQSVGAQGGEGPRGGHYTNCGAGLQGSKCTMQKSVRDLCDVYNDHFGFTSRGAFSPVRSAATEVGHPLREGGYYPSGNNTVRRNCVDESLRDDYSREERYYVHYEPMILSRKEKEKNKSTFGGVCDVDAYGERVDNGPVFLSRGKNRNGGGEGEGEGEEERDRDRERGRERGTERGRDRIKIADGEYYKAHVQDSNDVIPLEGKDLIGGAPSSYKARAKKSRREVKDITQVQSIHSDEGLSRQMAPLDGAPKMVQLDGAPKMVQLDDAPKMAPLDGAPKMAYTLRSSRKHPTNEKIEDPYCCKGESYEAQNGRGLEGAPEEGFVLFKTGLERRSGPHEGSDPHEGNNPTMGACNNGWYPKSGRTYADMGRNITQGESSQFNMLHFEKGNNPVERSVNDYVVRNALLDMDDSAQVFAEMASRCAPVEKSGRLPFESLHHGEVPSVGAIAAEGGLHSRTKEQHPELFSGNHFKTSGRAFTRNRLEDDMNVKMYHCADGGFSQGDPRRLRNYVEERHRSDASPNQSIMLRGVHITGEVPSSSSSSSRMVEPLSGENAPPHNELLRANHHDEPSYKMMEINRRINYQGRSEERSNNEGHYRYVKNDRMLNRLNGTSHNHQFFTNGESPFVYTLGEARGGATPDVYVIDEGTSGVPHSTHEGKGPRHHLGAYRQGMIRNENAQRVGDVEGKNAKANGNAEENAEANAKADPNAGSVKAEGTLMEQVQEGRAVDSRGSDAHASRDVSDQSYGRGMDDNTTPAIDQGDEESATDEDLSVQQAIINSLIDL